MMRPPATATDPLAQRHAALLLETGLRLAEPGDADAFMRHALRAVVEVLDGTGGVFWRGEGAAAVPVLEVGPAPSPQLLAMTSGASGAAWERGVETDLWLEWDGQRLGRLAVRVPAAGATDPQRLRVARAIAAQAALRLALAGRAGAKARADELADAHAALKRSLDLLGSKSDLDRFLGGVLGEIGLRIGAVHVVLCLAAAVHEGLSPLLAWHHGAVARGWPPAFAHGAGRAALQLALIRLQAEKAAVLWPTDQRAFFTPGDAQALADHRVDALLHLPLVLEGSCMGAITALLPPGVRAGPDEVELLQAFAHQATLAIRLNRLSAESEAAAVLQERARLAREIHDGIAQAFIGIGMQLQGEGVPPGIPAIARALALGEHGLAEARRAIKALRPVQLAGQPFVQALKAYATASLPPDVVLTVTLSGPWPRVAADREDHLFRIAQEALNNIARHARATEVAVELSASPREVSLLISDNGAGFDAGGSEDGGFGLLSMRQRADTIGAQLQLVSRPGRGTQVFVSLEPG